VLDASNLPCHEAESGDLEGTAKDRQPEAPHGPDSLRASGQPACQSEGSAKGAVSLRGLVVSQPQEWQR
jgi:hypothetical protein